MVAPTEVRISPSGLNDFSRLLKKAHLLRFLHPSSLRRTSKYASLLRISGALHLDIFEQPEKNHFFSNLLDISSAFPSPVRREGGEGGEDKKTDDPKGENKGTQ